MAKRKPENDELSGFVHDLTPIKVSKTNSKYFNCVLQTNTSEYTKLVCFDSVKRALFENAVQTKSPVKLKEVKQVPSRENSNSTDVLVNSRSDVQSIKASKLDFKFNPKSQELKTKEIRLKHVQTLPEKTLVCMNFFLVVYF